VTADTSPCINVCVVDPRTEFCIGCGRTNVEIAAWLEMSADARTAVIAVLPERLRAMTSRAMRQGGRRARTPTG
jgi:uncharacterized protein